MNSMQMKLELIMVPVTDLDRAKAFYTEKIGSDVLEEFEPPLEYSLQSYSSL